MMFTGYQLVLHILALYDVLLCILKYNYLLSVNDQLLVLTTARICDLSFQFLERDHPCNFFLKSFITCPKVGNLLSTGYIGCNELDM